MIDSNRLAIIVDDGAVYTDDKVIIGLDFSACGIPEDIHAIQWQDGQGEVEYRDTRHNFIVTDLPDWALACYQQFKSAPDDLPPI
jgi:hypothetical protein